MKKNLGFIYLSVLTTFVAVNIFTATTFADNFGNSYGWQSDLIGYNTSFVTIAKSAALFQKTI